MNFILNFKPDKAYYTEAYDEIISSLKYKKYEPYFAILLIGMGIILYFQDTYKVSGLMPIIFSLSGIYQLFKLYFEKKKWLKDRLDSKIVGQQIEMHFTDEGIKHDGPFSNGELNWNGLKTIVETKKGILIKPENGISIYLQNSLFKDKAQIEFILSKVEKSST